ncbi:16S rRNA (uracil(1498)-N(3))-methyltransferase [Marinoscillum sp. MHG1-6]|uniref:RsmE family RNA methyltransferase n=1 Tax=Marinoscillum sp. MHG1-6 TaxID=2959627 RepID=UPI0021589397|nr:RsmE family RNA methyltransferase [Marinoscillum sp. MHG1-6]
MNYFYQPDITKGQLFLEGEEFTHCTRVLRNAIGSRIGILDGIGGMYEVELTNISGKKCEFSILSESKKPSKDFYHHIALSPTKNIDRTEWFVEKACEMGVDEISFLLTKNSERNKLRIDRLEKKAISALKQSKSGYITKVNELVKFKNFLENLDRSFARHIAYVEEGLPYYGKILTPATRVLTLIGPEGDFDPSEVEMALSKGFEKISLGSNTLRTETAGLVACQFVNAANHY